MTHRRLALFLLALVAGLQTSCLQEPVIPQADFLKAMNAVVLAPQLTCDELKHYFGVPYVPTVDNPGALGVDYEEAFVPTVDGQMLRVWYIPAATDRGTIVLSMGAVGNMSCFLFVAQLLRFDGWSVVLYEYQGFGGSTGKPNVTTLYTDLEAVMDWTLARTGRAQLTLMGVSIGTIPAVAHAAERPELVNALILDAPIALDHEVDRFALLLGGDPAPYLAQLDDRLQLTKELPKVHQPLLAFTYGQDEYATSRQFFAGMVTTCPCAWTIVRFEALPHARGPYLATAKYFYAADQFLAGVWSGGAPTTQP